MRTKTLIIPPNVLAQITSVNMFSVFKTKVILHHSSGKEFTIKRSHLPKFDVDNFPYIEMVNFFQQIGAFPK